MGALALASPHRPAEVSHAHRHSRRTALMRALAILALSASSVLGLALSADDDGDARDVRVRGTFANTAAVAPARPLPKRLWYTLRIRYRGSEGGDIERHAPGFAGEVSSLFKAEAELRPESAILLRRRPGRTFSVLAGRSLTGRVTRLDTTFSETLPHCSALERQIAGIELGQSPAASGSHARSGPGGARDRRRRHHRVPRGPRGTRRSRVRRGAATPTRFGATGSSRRPRRGADACSARR